MSIYDSASIGEWRYTYISTREPSIATIVLEGGNDAILRTGRKKYESFCLKI